MVDMETMVHAIVQEILKLKKQDKTTRSRNLATNRNMKTGKSQEKNIQKLRGCSQMKRKLPIKKRRQINSMTLKH